MRKFGPEIDPPVGYRWELDPRDIFNVDTTPGVQLLGDLYEDLGEILDLLQRPEDETFVWHDLGHFIGLLQLLVVLDQPPEPGSRP